MADTTLRARGLPPGWTDLYFLIENEVGAVWNGTTFATFVVANWAAYRMVAIESPPSSGRYAFPFPAVPAGTYTWTLFRGPGSAADLGVGGPDSDYWSGSSFGLAVAPAPSAEQIRAELDANSSKLARLDVAVSTRSTYAGADTPGTGTLLTRLSLGRSLLLDNLDAAVSSRSTYAGADTSGVTTLLSRLTPVRAAHLDNLAADVLGGLVGGPTTGDIVAALLDAAVVNGTSLRLLLAAVAAVTCGNIVESADHTTTTITDINDPGGAARLTAINTPTTRQVSIH